MTCSGEPVCKLLGYFLKVCKTKHLSRTPVNEIMMDENNQPDEEVVVDDDELFIGAMWTDKEDKNNM